jgi:hypothetical protein
MIEMVVQSTHKPHIPEQKVQAGPRSWVYKQSHVKVENQTQEITRKQQIVLVQNWVEKSKQNGRLWNYLLIYTYLIPEAILFLIPPFNDTGVFMLRFNDANLQWVALSIRC